MKKITDNPKVYSFAEALSDISYIAGENKYHSGNSRQDVADFIEWAIEFEEINKNVEWDVDKDYIDTIIEFASLKIKEFAPEENKANILLIQKAPETLKVLTDLVEYLGTEWMNDPMVNKAIDQITKAKGLA